MALFNCPECGRRISDRAETCPHCGYPIKNEQVADTHNNSKPLSNEDSKINPWLISLPIVAIIAVVVGILSYSSSSSTQIHSEYAFDNNADMSHATITEWTYGTTVDELTNQVSLVSASIRSLDAERVSEYSNGYLLMSIIHSNDKYAPLMITFGACDEDGGRLSCDFEVKGLQWKFDDNAPVELYRDVLLAGNGRTLSITRTEAENFIQKLKSSKRCKIRVQFNQSILSTFDFNTEGLTWNY